MSRSELLVIVRRLSDLIEYAHRNGPDGSPVRLLANNRCITINTVLTRRFVKRSDRINTFPAKVVVVLTFLAVIVGGTQLYLLISN